MLRVRQEPPRIAGNEIVGDPDRRTDADVLRVGGEITPGFVTISKAGIPYKWEKRSAYGYGGAWLVFFGEDLVDFDATFLITREDQRFQWEAVWASKFKPPARPIVPQTTGFIQFPPSPPALGVYNPILAEVGITEIVPKFVGAWQRVGFGKWQKTLTFTRWKLPTPMLGKPSTAIPDVAKDTKPALTAAEIEQKEKLARFKALEYQDANGRRPPGKGLKK